MISTTPEDIKARAERWQAVIAGSTGHETAVVPARSAIGGGSLPGETLDSWALSISVNGAGQSPELLLSALRERSTPVIARIEIMPSAWIPRTVLPEQDDDIMQAIAGSLAS